MDYIRTMGPMETETGSSKAADGAGKSLANPGLHSLLAPEFQLKSAVPTNPEPVSHYVEQR